MKLQKAQIFILKRVKGIKKVNRLNFIFLFAMIAVANQVAAMEQQTDTIYVRGTKIPVAIGASSEYALIRTPKPGLVPKINGPKVYGARPGNPFLYRIPTTGKRPMIFAVKYLPAGLSLDKNTGIITGVLVGKGEFTVEITAQNNYGKSVRPLKIVSGDKLALTPPMGWNNWYAFYERITDKMMREAADHLVRLGMADAGYQYVSIDDCWMNAKENKDPGRIGPARDSTGAILPNSYFPDMKGLTDYIHSKGLKAGIYTSPGITTCAGFTGSFGYEWRDAKQFADWGFDFLKYDYCSYSSIEKEIKGMNLDLSPEQIMKQPYFNMGAILRSQKRDIIFNLCQYGRKVWEWGPEAGHSWRTGSDLGGQVGKFYDIAKKSADNFGKWSKPSAWNDLDYILIGYVGNPDGSRIPELTKLSPAEQYSFMSLWCLLSAPLFYSGDFSRLNEFTLNILCNTEVIAVNQDPLGKPAAVINRTEDTFVMVKELEDGSRAIGLFNKGKTPAAVEIKWWETGMQGDQLRVRDIWHQKNLGNFKKGYTISVPPRDVVFIVASDRLKK